MSEFGQDGATFKDAFEQAAHHHHAMVERRNIGLRIVVGVVAFDLIVLKLALEAADKVSDQGELAWAIRLIAAVAFAVLAEMLLQIEGRNRDDRAIYSAATERAEKIRQGKPPPVEAPPAESFWLTVSRSWATSWTLGGVLVLTIAIWWMAGLLAEAHDDPTSRRTEPAHTVEARRR